jgi:hypothetical protein
MIQSPSLPVTHPENTLISDSARAGDERTADETSTHIQPKVEAAVNDRESEHEHSVIGGKQLALIQTSNVAAATSPLTPIFPKAGLSMGWQAIESTPPMSTEKPLAAASLSLPVTSSSCWKPSLLCDDCTLTFPDTGKLNATLPGLSADLKSRKVSSERGGWFDASSVLVGVRFVVGT